MSDQLAIEVAAAGVPPHRRERTLTARQQLAFDYVHERDGVTADEVGAFLHAHRERRPHSVDERCEWCTRDGRGVLTSKAVKPLVKYTRKRGWVAKDKPVPDDGRYDPSTAEIPF